jgi:hypothetical protein
MPGTHNAHYEPPFEMRVRVHTRELTNDEWQSKTLDKEALRPSRPAFD